MVVIAWNTLHFTADNDDNARRDGILSQFLLSDCFSKARLVENAVLPPRMARDA